MHDIESSDIFKTRYKIGFVPFQGADFSKKCFVFPGQGVAQPRMGQSLLERHEPLIRRFQKADALAKAKDLCEPSLFILDPNKIPAKDLSLVRNLCLFTMSVGLFELLLSQNERPALLTSHSFGEYAGLVAGGVISFEDMFEILILRETACAPAHSLGGMIAVSGDRSAISLALGETLNSVHFANFNSPRQTVLALEAAKIKPVLQALKKAKVPAKLLESVPQPYHSPLMMPAVKAFLQNLNLKKIAMQKPITPILSSVLGEVLSESNFSREKILRILTEQMTAPVRFQEQIQLSRDQGVCHFIEISVQKLAAQWISDTLGEAAHKVTTPAIFKGEAVAAGKKQFRATHDSKMVGLLNKVISSVTGYSIAEISLSKNFQEDLGIDSIKKAQIVLNFLESQGKMGDGLQDGVMMNQLRTIEDVLTWFTTSRSKQGQGRAADFQLYQKSWKQRSGAPDSTLVTQALEVSCLSIADAASEGFSESFLKRSALVFFDDGRDWEWTGWLKAFQNNYGALRELPSSFVIVFTPQTSSRAETLGLEGFLRSLCKEVGCQFQKMEFEHWNSESQKIVEQEMKTAQTLSVRFQNGKRFELEYETAQRNGESSAPRSVAAIGGATGATYEILKSLRETGCDRFAIMGRRASNEVEAELRELAKSGARVEYVQGDATHVSDLDRFLKIALKDGDIDLVIHGGGVEHSALVEDQDEKMMERQLAVKLTTVRHLRELWSPKLKRLICFSSTAGEFGNAGQSIYAWANVAMAEECARAQQAGLNFSAIAWPAWNQVGMTAKPEIAGQLKLTGLHLLDAERAGEIFRQFLSGTDSMVCMDHGFKLIHDAEQVRLRGLQALFAKEQLPGLHFPIRLEHWTSRDLPALRDHFIMDQSLVPVSFPLTVFWHLAGLLNGRPCRLKNVEASSFMVLHRRDSPYLLDVKATESDASSARAFEFEIRSNQTHVKGEAVPLSEEDLDLPLFHESAQFRYIDMFKQSYSRFGRNLHLLENVRVTVDDRAHADVDVSKHVLFEGSDSVNRQLVLFEALFHLSGAASEAKTGRVSVPLSFASVVVNEKIQIGQKFKLVVQCRYPMQDILEADLYVYNENGDACAAIMGERLRLFNGEVE